MVSVPEPIVIKIEDDTSPPVTVIDVDSYVSTEDKITNWHNKVRERINNTFGIECETSLENLMKWYIDTLNQEILSIDVNRRFILIMDKHLYCFHSYFKALNWISAEGYLDSMEDILAFYLDCEGKIFVTEIGRQKRNKKQMRKKLLSLLRIYLMGQEDRIHHVLMKMRLNLCKEEAKSFLDNIFRVVFYQKPIDKSDAAFCRAFILLQKWKRIQKPDIWKVLDEMLETMYGRTLDSIHSNGIWKEIPSKNGSLLDVMAHIGDSDRALYDGYFKYMKTQNAEENIDAACFTKTHSSAKSDIDLIIDSDSIESGEFHKLMESCPKRSETVADEEDCVVKDEVDSDDDCVIVTGDALEIDPQKVVYEILDDSDAGDIIEFADLQIKEPCASVSNSCARRAKKGEEMSFLDSIEITASPRSTAGEKQSLQTDSVSSPLTKLQNSDNDSVKSREILSRKFTRKKEAALVTKSTTKSNFDSIELLDDSKMHDGAARGTVSRSEDDRAKMHVPHSTISSNNSPKSTESTEVRPSESYVSPTSPDISSTCDPNATPQDESDLSDDNHRVEPGNEETRDGTEAEHVADQRKEISESIAHQRIEAQPVLDNNHPINVNSPYFHTNLTYFPHITNMVNSQQPQTQQPPESILDRQIKVETCAGRRIEAEPVFDERIEIEPVIVDERFEAEQVIDERIEDEQVIDERIEDEQVIDERIEDEQVIDERIEDEQVIDERIEDEPVIDERIEAEPVIDERIEVEPVVVDEMIEVEPFAAERTGSEPLSDSRNATESLDDRNEIELFVDADDYNEAEPFMNDRNEAEPFMNDRNEFKSFLNDRNDAKSFMNDRKEAEPLMNDRNEAEPFRHYQNEVKPFMIEPEPFGNGRNEAVPFMNDLDDADLLINRQNEGEQFGNGQNKAEQVGKVQNEAEPVANGCEPTDADEEIETELESLRTIAVKKETISPVKLNGRNGETIDSWSVKSGGDISTRIDENQLAVTVPKHNAMNSDVDGVKRKMEVIFTHKVRRSNNEVHLRYDDLKDNHCLDDCLVGELEKSGVSRTVTMNGIADFDLFADPAPSPKENRAATAALPQQATPVSTSSPSDLQSPEYDCIDDFRNYYLANYQQDGSIGEKSDQNKNLLQPQTNTNSPTTSLKRKRISFAKENTVYTIDTRAPPMASAKAAKKPVERHLRILISRMNLNALVRSKTAKPPNDDVKVKRRPVVAKRASETEAKQYKKRKRRDTNAATATPPITTSQPNANSMTLFQINYDKSTPWPSESDTVHFTAHEERTWRTNNNNNHQKFDAFDEGTVDQTFDIEDYLYIPPNCDNLCCALLSGILDDFLYLIPRDSRPAPVPRNPFYTDELRRRIAAHERERKYSFSDTEDDNLSNDLQDLKKVVSKIVDNCSEFINQPAAIPEVEEYEKTLQSEEVAKVSTIPSDLHNLNLRKFSPSPVLTFSSHSNSPAHNFFSDFYNGGDKANEADFNDNSNGPDLAGIVPAIQNSAEEELVNASNVSELADVPSSSSSEESKEELMQDKPSSIAVEACPPQTRLPLKKRKHSFANAMGDFDDDDEDDFIGPEVIEEIIKRARAEENEKDDISYPAKPAISIAEIQEKLVDSQQPRTFKTPAQKKEMPPAAAPLLLPQPPNIVTEQYNNHTYNNPTINYHMNSVPYPFFPCTNLTYFPPILLPMNSTTTFDMNMVNSQQHLLQQQQQHQMPLLHEQPVRVKKEKRSKRRRRN